MSVELLLGEFGRLGEAPNAVPRLRRFVLEAAVRGLLVAQDPQDGDVAALLEQATVPEFRPARRATLSTEFPDPHEVPFSLPSSWLWCRLSQIGFVVGGGTPPSGDAENFTVGGEGIPWFTPADMAQQELIEVEHGRRDLTQKGFASSSTALMPPGTILFTSRAPIGYVGIAKYAVTTNQGFKSLVPSTAVDSRYVAICFRAFAPSIDADAPGTTFKEVSGKLVSRLPFPLPPLAEQSRIVARVDELLELCDDLEMAQTQRDAHRDALRSVSLNRLILPKGDWDGHRDVRFFLDASPRLLTKPEHVAAVRQTILDLGVWGKLTPQNPTDVPALELLQQIETEREKLLSSDFPNPAEARVQRRKQAKQVLPQGLPPLPTGWCWATLMQCSAIVVDCKNKTVPYTSSGITLLRTTNIKGGHVVLRDHRFVSDETYLRWTSRYQPQPGDIVITREAPMGEVARIPPGLKACLGQRLMVTRLIENTIDPGFLVYSLRDSALLERVQDKPIGALVEHLRVGGVETLLVPLPPLAEQQRIVAKLDELMSVCDELERALTSARLENGRLLESILHEVLSDASEDRAAGT